MGYQLGVISISDSFREINVGTLISLASLRIVSHNKPSEEVTVDYTNN